MMPENFLYVVFSILLLYYLYFISIIYRGLGRLRRTDKKNNIPEFISIVIPFRNESKNLPGNLKGLVAQNYPGDKYEIIYVNDSSTDDSVEVLKQLIATDNISAISVPDEFSPNAHKKRAVRYGIQNAKGDLIITTDADCFHEKDWLQTMVNYLDQDTAFVSGPVEFIEKANVFSTMQKIEFAGLVITGAGLIGIKKPTICNAANILYRKKVFDEVNGFNDNLNLSSGDDELLMQKIHKKTKYKIAFCPERKAVVKTEANNSVEQFYQQRKRWASKGLFYADKLLIAKLILIFWFYLGLLCQLILGIFYSSEFFVLLILSFILKILFEFLVMKRGVTLLFDKKIMKYFLLTELFHIPYIVIAGISGIFGNFTWKERVLKR
jgi:cellulose synthase/poly-beta-1,6-N-acetylglucosamine synthase-like glycosyltransferase